MNDYTDAYQSLLRFNPSSADRHLKFCAEQAKKGKPGDVKGKAEAASRRDKMKGVSIKINRKYIKNGNVYVRPSV